MLSLIGGVNAALTTGLTAYYDMSNTLDSSGNGNTLTNYGATLTTGKIGNAYSFNNNYLQTNFPFPINSAPFSYSIWIKANSYSATYPTIIYGGTDWNGGVWLKNNMIRAHHTGIGGMYKDYSFTTDLNWHHIVYVWTGNDLLLYNNGVLLSPYSTTPYTPTSTNGNILLGKNTQNSINYWNGKLDELGIWNRALTQAEITQLYNNGQGLNPLAVVTPPTPSINHNTQQYYNTSNINISLNTTTPTKKYYALLDNSSSQTFNDGILDGFTQNNGTFMNGANLTANYDLNFDGVNDHIKILNGSKAKHMTISLWVKPKGNNVQNSYQMLLSKSDWWGPYSLILEQSGSITFSAGNAYTQTTRISGGFIDNTKWYHVLMTCGTNGLKAYIDNNVVAQSNTPCEINSTFNSDLNLGDSYFVSHSYNGSMNGITIYNRALSSSEIQQIYNNGRHSYTPITNGLVAQYTGNDFQGTTANPTTLTDTNMIGMSSGNKSIIVAKELNNKLNTIGVHNYNQYTFSFNVKANQGMSFNPRIMTPTDTHWILYQTNHGKIGFYSSNAQAPFTTDNTWQEFTITYDRITHIAKVYKNGAFVAQDNNIVKNAPIGQWRLLHSESDSAGADTFYGSISKSKIYNRILNQTEITSLYNNQSVRKGLVWSQGGYDSSNNKILDRLNVINVTPTLSNTINLNNLADDLYKINYKAIDNNGLSTANASFTIDTTPPVIQTNITNLIHLNNYTYNFSNYINITDLTNTTYNISVNNQPSNYTHIFTTNGNYTVKVIAKDIVNNTNIYTTNIIVDLFRINMTFQSNISTLLLNNINITENPGALNYFTNTSDKLIYINPGSYNFTFNKSLYNITTILNYTKDNATIQQELLVTFKPIFIFNLIDEQSLLSFNISGATSVNLKVYCSDGTIIQKVVTTKIYNYIPSCIPTNFGFNVIYGTQNYFRDITSLETNLNRSVYLMDLFKSQMVQNNFVIFDLTSKYTNPRLSIQKIIPNEGQVEITGDEADIQNSVTGYLLQNSEYILQLSSDNQPTKNLGIYIASAGGTENINLFDVNFKINNPSQGKVQMHSYIQNGTIISTYNDLSNSTILADLKLYNQTRYGNIIFQSQISNNPQSGSFSYNIPNILENTSLLAILTITTNTGTYIDKRILRQNNNLSLGLIGFTLSMDWIITIFLAFIALIFTIRTADVGSILLMIFAAFFVTIGWYSLSWIVISIGLLLSILKILREGERQ